MGKYQFKATNLIAEAFDSRSVQYHVLSHHNTDQLVTGCMLRSGPPLIVQFLSCDDGNAVAMRVHGLVPSTPADKRSRMLEACNVMNCDAPYLKFCLDDDGNVNVQYDFPNSTPDSSVGEFAFEMFVRLAMLLESQYSIFTKALSTEGKLEFKLTAATEVQERQLEELRRLEEELKARKADSQS